MGNSCSFPLWGSLLVQEKGREQPEYSFKKEEAVLGPCAAAAETTGLPGGPRIR